MSDDTLTRLRAGAGREPCGTWQRTLYDAADEIGRLREENEMLDLAADHLSDLSDMVWARDAVIESLQSRLAEITDAHRVVMEERCHADERHCTCVPVLRAEVARLSRELEQASDIYLHAVIDQRESDCREKNTEIERLCAALERLMDVQNGPPLIRDRVEWNEAMAQACEVVGRDATFYREAVEACTSILAARAAKAGGEG